MTNHRPTRAAFVPSVVAWLMPLVMVLSWSSGAAAMFCQAQGVLIHGGCCCGTMMSDVEAAGAERTQPPGAQTPQPNALQSADCCVARAAAAPVALCSKLPVEQNVAPVVWTLCQSLDVMSDAPAPCLGWSSQPVARAPDRPLVLLKRAFLI